MDDTTVVINAEDRTGPAFRAAAESAARLDRNLRDVGKRNLSGGIPTPEEWNKRTQAANKYWTQTRNLTDQTRNLTEQTRNHESAIAGVGHELMGMAARYLGVAEAVNEVRKGFLEFTNEQEQMRVMQARMSATKHEMEGLEETIAAVSKQFGFTKEQVAGLATVIKDTGNFSNESLKDIEAIAPAIAEVSRRYNLDLHAMGESFASVVRQMNIAPSDWEKVVGALSFATTGLNLDMNQLNRFLPQVTETFAQLGIKGTSGLSLMMAFLGETKGKFDSAAKAGRALNDSMQEIQRGGGVAAALGLNDVQWSRGLEEAKARGEDIGEVWMDAIKRALVSSDWAELFTDPRQRQFWKSSFENWDKIKALQEKASAAGRAFHSGNTKDLEDNDLALKRLGLQWSELTTSVGGFLSTIGVGGVFGRVTQNLTEISNLIKGITGLLDKAREAVRMPEIHLPTVLGLAEKVGQMNLFIANQLAPKSSAAAASEHQGRRGGGSVRSGIPYVVGESGPELFVPEQSGNIRHNASLGAEGTAQDIKVDTHTSLSVLMQIRDLLQKADVEANGVSGGGSGGGGSSAGGGGLPTSGGQGLTPRSMRRGGGENNALNPSQKDAVSGGGPIVGSLATQRQRYINELNNDPALKDYAIDAMKHEGGIQSNMEQLFNYASMRGMTIKQALHSGQYGPVNTGQISGRISAATRAKGQAAIDKVGAGSNITDYATDQGMVTDPNGRKYANNPAYYNRKVVEGAIFSYHGERGRKWAQRQRAAAAAAEQNAKAPNNGLDQPALNQKPEIPTGPPAELQNNDAAGVGGIDMNALSKRAKDLRSELEQPITIRAQLDRGQDSQFRRTSIRREVNREVREGAWNSVNDIGAA